MGVTKSGQVRMDSPTEASEFELKHNSFSSDYVYGAVYGTICVYTYGASETARLMETKNR